MIKRDHIRACEAAYVHHVQANAWKGAIDSLRSFKKAWPDDPAIVLECMEGLLRAMHRDKRRDAIRTLKLYIK